MSSSDQIFQEFKLYIEGVQTPWINITITQSMGSLPQANIVIPPQVGLMDIARFYQPKVDIFFNERDTNIDKVLFTGVIVASSYNKSKEGNSGSMGVNFTCIHRYNLITECLVDYAGAVRDAGTDLGGTTASAGMADLLNSTTAIVEALSGWTKVGVGGTTINPLNDYSTATPLGPTYSSPDPAVGSTSRTDVLPSYLAPFANRLIGMPGVFINYWNQLARASFNPYLKMYQGGFRVFYKPLIEDGLNFFRRLSGHMLIEKAVNNDKQTGCGPNNDKTILVPPAYQVFLKSSVQANLAITNMRSFMQNSNDTTNIYSIFQNFYQTMEYDIITLACPAEVPKDPNISGVTYAVDTIVKPSMPFYYSPNCNVLFPSMYTSISVNYDESSMPTRLDVLNDEDGGVAGAFSTHFRSPASIRTAIAEKNTNGNSTLAGTTGPSFGAIGRYEMGRGIKYEATSMPNWLSSIFTSFKNNTAENNAAEVPPPDSAAGKAIQLLRAGWKVRYPKHPEMNPWDPESNILPHQRILFLTADYYYTKKFASTKAGNINCLFNPYIIPGYPMDVMEASPNLPSFHGLCVAVSHNISANMVSTQVSFAAAMTYTELANYYVPFINPYLEVQLGLAANPTLVNTDSGAALGYANDFYNPTIGVKAVRPETLFDYKTGIANSVKIDGNGQIVISSGNLAEHSFEDDLLTICKRPIESKDDYATRSNVSFIDMIPQNYSATGVKYQDPKLSGTNVSKFEIGESQFLDYSEEIYYSINGITSPVK